MSMFVQKSNSLTGATDWILQNENYDHYQEVARSSFADMLHDTERNQKYEAALKLAIESTHARGKQATVLDIGTGTGLLSMMAVRHGADQVVACEAFEAMSECARKVIKRNRFSDRIRIIPKRSTDLKVGPNGDLSSKFNILVTEVFDTELIGEGAITTFSHAHKFLLEEDCIVVPKSATIYAQVVESPFVQCWNKVKDVYDDDGRLLVRFPKSVKDCAGSAAVHDLQLNQLELDMVKFLSEPVSVFRFDWSGQTPFIFERSTIQPIQPKNSGIAQAIFMWWELQMDVNDKVVLSCGPHWANPCWKGGLTPWRDHWMQAIYYLPKELTVSRDTELNLISCHDEYSLWFSVKSDLKLSEKNYVKPVCECGLHVTCSRTRVGQMNDSRRNKAYLRLLEKHVNETSVLLVLSHGFYSSLSASVLGAKRIYYVETNHLSRRILQDVVECNKITNVQIFKDVKELVNANIEKVNMVFGEPYFSNSILPWDNLLFMYMLREVRSVLTPNCKVLPTNATIKGIAVNFSDLNKIRLRLGSCEGFNMEDFDDLIEHSSNISDDIVEAQPLWEYPGVAVSKVIDLISIDLQNMPETSMEIDGSFISDQRYESCNGIALWIDWLFDEEASSDITTGPIEPTELGKTIQWDVHTRQGVCLFENKAISEVRYKFKFDFVEGNTSFRCC